MSDLLQKFGVKELKDFQQESVDNLLEGKDVYLSDFLPPIPKSFTFINVILIG
jgi:hypothetical protein